MKGLTFGNKHSYDDFNLILTGCDIAPCHPKTNYIDIEGADGSLDLTESLGAVKYSDRDATFTFSTLPFDDIESKKTELTNAINGKRMKVILDKDPNFYYIGRLSVDSYESKYPITAITVTGRLEPWKYKKNKTSKAANLSSTSQSLNLNNSRKPVVPVITVSENATVVFGSKTVTLTTGVHKATDIILTEGDNVVSVTGSGTITFEYQEGVM